MHNVLVTYTESFDNLYQRMLSVLSDFKWLRSYTNTQSDLECRKAQPLAAVHVLHKVSRSFVRRQSKLRVFKTTVESILLYGCESWTLTKTLEKPLDGTYTWLLRRVWTFLGMTISLTRICMVLCPASLLLWGNAAFVLLVMWCDATWRTWKESSTLEAWETPEGVVPSQPFEKSEDTSLSGVDLVNVMAVSLGILEKSHHVTTISECQKNCSCWIQRKSEEFK